MTEQIIPALITGAILSMIFPTTRNMGILATSALAFMYPLPVMIIVLITATIFVYKKVFSKWYIQRKPGLQGGSRNRNSANPRCPMGVAIGWGRICLKCWLWEPLGVPGVPGREHRGSPGKNFRIPPFRIGPWGGGEKTENLKTWKGSLSLQ